MILPTLCIFCTTCISSAYGFQIPFKFSSTLGDNAVVLVVLAAFGTATLIGACALCFRRKKTFEKLENEAGSPENLKKNEYPIFRALSTEVNESSSSSAAIVPCERNNLSRDNLLNSSENLVSDDINSARRIDAVDSSEIFLLEKSATSSQRERLQQQSNSRDTIIYETEKRLQSPSSKTPLLYAKNVQSYQEQQPISEQIQQKSVAAVFLSHETTLNNFYHAEGDDINNVTMTKVEVVDELAIKNLSVDNETTKGYTSTSSASNTNPFFTSTVEDCTVKEILKDDLSEIESSINDNSEKYQILEEETDGEDVKNTESNEDDLPLTLHRQNSKGSNCSTNDKSVEEALRVLDIAIGFDDEEEEDEMTHDTNKTHAININEIKEEATFLVESIVNDCEKILEARAPVSEKVDNCFEDFLSIKADNMSTPCDHSKTQKISCISNVDVAKVLFPGGVDLSEELINNDTFPISSNNATFDVTPPQQSLQQVTVNDKTFDANSNNTVELPAIKIEKEGDEMGSEDLTTVTPVNTPIELSYSSETWNKISYGTGAISKQSNIEAQNKTFDANECDSTITFNHDGWYLHPQSKSETFEIFEEEDGNMEDMTSTYDQLRRQLTEMLPHAQGMSTHNDFLDDDLNKESISPNGNNYGIKYGELDEATNAGSFDVLNLNSEPLAEININYNTNSFKRPLSPIMEESECDETCRTFILNNDTKLLDSTSTGVMESASADAIIGQMPKTLMASNDTLFNFEDTLSDPADLLMSPRIHTAGSSTSSTLSRQESHDRISNERTPTNEDLPKIPSNDITVLSKSQELDAIDILKNNIRQHPLTLDLNLQESEVNMKYDLTKIALEKGTWPIELPEAQQIINDLSSPEQNRGDSLSFEQDITYTIDDQKTCVSFVLKNDEERISEISEPNFATESLADDDDRANNSLLIDDVVSLETDDNFNYEINDENGNQSIETKEKEICLKETEEVYNYENDSINPIYDKTSNYDIDSLEAERKILNDEIEVDSISASHRSKSIYSNDSINKNEKDDSVQKSDNSAADCGIANQNDSSDDSEGSDRKKGSSEDIRQVSCNQSVMSTSFTKEWSDDDSSHSSEEFMYVKGQVEDILTSVGEGVKDGDNDDAENKQMKNEGEENVDEIEEVAATWSNLSSQKSPLYEDEEVDEESGEEEESWKPSYWDQSLQPIKSSLKSPEKESSHEQQGQPIKTRRRVAFKVQRYHSVYEYPSEVVQLSPAYSEPHLWSSYLNNDIDYFAYANEVSTALDGFNISSSSRPFHNNNSTSAQLHNTWPTESSDFSWSQFQDSNELDEAIKETSERDVPYKIEWPIRKNSGCLEEDDSGVCESSDSHSFGELNCAKNSLRLPLPVEHVSSTSSEVSDFMSTDIVTKDLNAVKIEILNEESQLQPNNNLKMSNINDDERDKVVIMNDSILPTPLSGSMDSLSSHSASSNSSSSPSFTTFGKENKIIKESDCNGKTSIIFIEDDRINRVEAIDTRKMLGSSDSDDSGFENVQIKCEAK